MRKGLYICVVFAVLASAVLSSCGSGMQICESKKIDANSQNAIMRYMDKDSQIMYDFANNDSVLVISIETLSRPIQMRMIKTGVRFYLSQDGSKSKTKYVQYPVQNTEPRKFEDLRARGEEQGMQEIVKNIDKKLKVVDGTNEESFYLDIDKISYNFKIEADNEGRFRYMAYIGLKNLHRNIEDSTTVIGIELPKLEIPKRQDRAERAGMEDAGFGNDGGMGGGPGGMPGGGMPGGGRGGMGGGRGGHGGGERRLANTEDIKFWVNLKLK